MKIYKIIVCAALGLMMASCAITGKIARHQTNAEIIHSSRQQREIIEQQKEEYHKGYVEYTRVDSSKVYLIPTTKTPDGESLMTLDIEGVTVTAGARFRSLPERMGKVNIDFVVTLPKELMGNCRGVEVTPFLHKEDEDIPLQELTIRGALFDKVQQRNYWQYDRYLDVFKPDEEGRQRAYERFIYYPYPDGVRLDSVVSNKQNISYFYTQEVPTADVGNKLLITLQGKVAALDHSEYCFPLSDTLEYNISSMLSFVDTTTRYVVKVIEKYAVVNDRNYLNYPVNKAVIVDSLGDNRSQLDRIEWLMDEIINQNEFHIDSIILTASASPEGTVRKNDLLAKDRANSLRDHLVKRFPDSRMDTLITVRWIGEDWDELERLLRADDSVKNHDEIIGMINNNRHGDLDALEKEIKGKFPTDYRYMLEELYPKLRAVNFKYDLRRVGMVKDTVHTTVPDMIYANGVELLKSRKYEDALRVLYGFYDRNTAICLLSLGEDERAYNTLKSLPASSTNEYLMAIACARLGRKEEALEHFDKACELNSQLEYRGILDPEISTLIKQREEGN